MKSRQDRLDKIEGLLSVFQEVREVYQMAERFDFDKLVEQAGLGNRESMEQLAREAELRLRAYIYRTTLDEDLTNDLVQETLLEMVKSLKGLRRVKNFWPWVFRIASNKTIDYFRMRKSRSAVQFSTLEDSLLDSVLRDESGEAAGSVMRRELGQMVFRAIAKLKYRQRAILSLRCFEDMPYPQIAQAVGCTENEARVSFFRAKQALKRQLTRRGFSKSSLLMAVVFFGKLTAPTSAAALDVTVRASALKGIGAKAMLLGLAKSPWAAVPAAAVIAAGVAGLNLNSPAIPDRGDVRSVRFVRQGVWDMSGSTGSRSSSSSSSSSSSLAGGAGAVAAPMKTKGAYGTWMRFPEGPDGPVIRRDQRYDIDQTEKWCSWLQDGNANYYYHAGEKTIYMTNDPLRALLLPTDLPEFAEFIMAMTGSHPNLKYIRDSRTGLLAGRLDNRVPAVKDFKTAYKYNSTARKFFDYGWPEGTEKIDQRDQMHKRGWTYFKVSGRIGNRSISGRGRIPFVYTASKAHSPWLELDIDDGSRIVDTERGAYLLNRSGTVLARFRPGSFFKGLARPWMGIRAYDIVRRDAAEKRIRFESERLAEQGYVKLSGSEALWHTDITYSIDMARDIIESIGFSKSDDPEGQESFLTFSYLDEVSDAGPEFIEPIPPDSDLRVTKSTGIIWLFNLAEGTLGEL